MGCSGCFLGPSWLVSGRSGAITGPWGGRIGRLFVLSWGCLRNQIFGLLAPPRTEALTRRDEGGRGGRRMGEGRMGEGGGTGGDEKRGRWLFIFPDNASESCAERDERKREEGGKERSERTEAHPWSSPADSTESGPPSDHGRATRAGRRHGAKTEANKVEREARKWRGRF